MAATRKDAGPHQGGQQQAEGGQLLQAREHVSA